MISYEILKEKIRQVCENYSAEATGGFITGDGPIPCNILFVGEAPGKTEVAEGRPFVGAAGKTFEKYLNSIGLFRSEVRITNACYFRPIKIKISENGKSTISNRPPKPFEVNLFKEILDEEVILVNPKILITLGNIPLKRLTSFTSIGDCHGNLLYNETFKKYIFPMYHPSSLIYNRNESFLQTYSDDWAKLKKALESI